MQLPYKSEHYAVSDAVRPTDGRAQSTNDTYVLELLQVPWSLHFDGHALSVRTQSPETICQSASARMIEAVHGKRRLAWIERALR